MLKQRYIMTKTKKMPVKNKFKENNREKRNANTKGKIVFELQKTLDMMKKFLEENFDQNNKEIKQLKNNMSYSRGLLDGWSEATNEVLLNTSNAVKQSYVDMVKNNIETTYKNKSINKDNRDKPIIP